MYSRPDVRCHRAWQQWTVRGSINIAQLEELGEGQTGWRALRPPGGVSMGNGEGPAIEDFNDEKENKQETGQLAAMAMNSRLKGLDRTSI
jgi:hypothetical protein